MVDIPAISPPPPGGEVVDLVLARLLPAIHRSAAWRWSPLIMACRRDVRGRQEGTGQVEKPTQGQTSHTLNRTGIIYDPVSRANTASIRRRQAGLPMSPPPAWELMGYQPPAEYWRAW